MNAHETILDYILDQLDAKFTFSMLSYDKNPGLHLALTLSGFSDYKDKCTSCFMHLLKAEYLGEPLDVNVTDRLGRSVMHLAAMNDL
jgi:ankyrin repeat protein